MYPSQTSFIPIQVALARFLETNGGRAFFLNYPHWYFGTTSYRYLSGPILPMFANFFHGIFPVLNLFEIFFLLVGLSFLVGVLGVYFLVKELQGKTVAALVAVFYLFGPIIPFLFRFSDGLFLISFSFLPYILLLYLKLLKNWTKKQAVFLVISLSFAILINSLIIPSLVLGMMAILLATIGWRRIEKVLKKTFLIFTFSFLISTIWYTPGYWWQVLVAPSFAGKPFFQVVGQLAQLLPSALAIGLAIFSIRVIKPKNQGARFCFYWLFVFGFLTIIRFLSDPDFWLDWSSYGLELQMGGGIALGMLIFKILNLKNISILLCIFTIYFLLFTITFNKYVLSTLQADISQAVEYRIGEQLAKIVKPGERVFLSGTTAFWLNAFFDIPQVRGGIDQVSVDPNWRKMVWEIREGADAEKSLKWLKDLKVTYLVVHTHQSQEFYHDFTHPEKFEGVKELNKIYDQSGDRIYQIVSE